MKSNQLNFLFFGWRYNLIITTLSVIVMLRTSFKSNKLFKFGTNERGELEVSWKK
jgi:hypothetical protein